MPTYVLRAEIVPVKFFPSLSLSVAGFPPVEAGDTSSAHRPSRVDASPLVIDSTKGSLAQKGGQRGGRFEGTGARDSLSKSLLGTAFELTRAGIDHDSLDLSMVWIT